MMQIKALQQELKQLPADEKLQLAHWLLDSILADKERPVAAMAGTNPLLEIAGMFEGGPGDTAERAKEEMKTAVDQFLAREISEIPPEQRQAYEKARQIVKKGRQPGEPRILGAFAGLITTSDDFDAPLPDEALFLGEETDPKAS
jgi:hypothetical protein